MSTVYMGRGMGFNLYLGMRWIESAFVRRKKELRLQNPGLGAFLQTDAAWKVFLSNGRAGHRRRRRVHRGRRHDLHRVRRLHHRILRRRHCVRSSGALR